MSRSTYDLIGEIINPQPRPAAASRAPRAAAPAEPVDVLIGRIIHPGGPPAAPLQVERIDAAAPTTDSPAPSAPLPAV